MTYAFQDTFTGSGNLSTHNPDTGSAYSADGPGALTAAILNGTGGLPLVRDGSNVIYARSTFTRITATTYTLSTAFTISTTGVATIEIDVAAIDTVGGAFLIDLLLRWNGSAWHFIPSVTNAANSLLYGSSNTVAVSVGAHTMSATVTPGGVDFQIDGVSVVTTAQIPDILPNAVDFEPDTSGVSSTGYLDYVQLLASPLFWTGYVKVVEA